MLCTDKSAMTSEAGIYASGGEPLLGNRHAGGHLVNQPNGSLPHVAPFSRMTVTGVVEEETYGDRNLGFHGAE